MDNMVNQENFEQVVEEKQDGTIYKNFFIAEEKTTVKEEDDETLITVPIQALSSDREEDEIVEEGQKNIIKQLQSGKVPAFPNHGMGDSGVRYDYREILGQWVDGKLNNDGVTMGKIRLMKDNDDAKILKDLIEADMPVGFSVGFKILDSEEKSSSDGLKIKKVDLLEVSPVGIPAHQDAVANQDREKVKDNIKSLINSEVDNMTSSQKDIVKDEDEVPEDDNPEEGEDLEPSEEQTTEERAETSESDEEDKQDEDMMERLDELEDRVSIIEEKLEDLNTEETDEDEDKEDDEEEDEEDETEEDSEKNSDLSSRVQELEDELNRLKDEDDGEENTEDSEEEDGDSLDEDDKTISDNDTGQKLDQDNNDNQKENNQEDESVPKNELEGTGFNPKF